MNTGIKKNQTYSILRKCLIFFIVISMFVPTMTFAVSGDEVAADGSYTGSGHGEKKGSATLTVVVKDGKISDITNLQAKKADKYHRDAERVKGYMIGKPATCNAIDAVSGPTHRKYENAIKNAVLNALGKASASNGRGSSSSNDVNNANSNKVVVPDKTYELTMEIKPFYYDTTIRVTVTSGKITNVEESNHTERDRTSENRHMEAIEFIKNRVVGKPATVETGENISLDTRTGCTISERNIKNAIMKMFQDASKENKEKTFTVTWKNVGTILEVDENVRENSRPEYNGETPKKASNGEYRYEFAGWGISPAAASGKDVSQLENVVSNTVYYAIFSRVEIPKIRREVRFKVVNGNWKDGTRDDKVVVLSGREGDTLRLESDQIPAVGENPAENYKRGSWNVMPQPGEVREDKIFTYTYVEDKEKKATLAVEEAERASNQGEAKKAEVELDGVVNPVEKEAVDRLNEVTRSKKQEAVNQVNSLSEGDTKTALTNRLNAVAESSVTVNDLDSNGISDDVDRAESAVREVEILGNQHQIKKTEIEKDGLINPSEKAEIDAFNQKVQKQKKEAENLVGLLENSSAKTDLLNRLKNIVEIVVTINDANSNGVADNMESSDTDNDSKLTISITPVSVAKEQLPEVLKKYDKSIEVKEIHLENKNGDTVSPSEEVEVRVLLDSIRGDKIRVFHEKATGELNEVKNITVEGSSVVFKTKDFSRFFFVAEVNSAGDNNKPHSNDNNSQMDDKGKIQGDDSEHHEVNNNNNNNNNNNSNNSYGLKDDKQMNSQNNMNKASKNVLKNNAAGNTAQVVKTGDNSNVGIYGVMFAFMGVFILGIIRYRKI